MKKNHIPLIPLLGFASLLFLHAVQARAQEKASPKQQFATENERCEKDLRALAMDTSLAKCIVVEAEMAHYTAHSICNRALMDRCAILFSVDLIRSIEDQDVSAILAHEMGHVDAFFKDAGDATLEETLEVECATDVFAVDLLRKSSIAPERLIAMYKMFSRTFGSNKVSARRIKKLERYIGSTR